MAINSKRKGKTGELEAVNYLKGLGFHDAKRTQQYNGIGKSDVECPESLPGLHIEVKRVAGMNVGSKLLDMACRQAYGDCDGGPWVVLWRPNRGAWRLSFAVNGVPSHWFLCTVCGDRDIKNVLWCLKICNPEYLCFGNKLKDSKVEPGYGYG